MKEVERKTGYDNRTLVHALYLLNKDKGVKFYQDRYDKSKKDNEKINQLDPGMAETRAIYQSSYVVKNQAILIPTKEDVDRLIADGKIGSRPDWMNDAIETGKSVQGFLKGYAEGFYEAGKEAAVGSYEMIRDLLTGELATQLIKMVEELYKMGPDGVWDAVKEMAKGSYKEFMDNWNNPNPAKKWEYFGKIYGMIIFEVAMGILTAGAGNYIKNIPKVKKVLDKLPKLKNIISKKAPEIEKNKNPTPNKTQEASAPPLILDKALETLLAPFRKLREKLPGIQSVLGNKKYKEFENYLRTLPEGVLKKLEAEPELIEEFAKRSLRDPDFAKAVKSGDLKKIDEIKNVSKIQRTLPQSKPDLNAKPKGQRTKTSKNDSNETIRSLDRENESADILTKKGFEVEQNPKIPNSTKKPDFLVNGKIFDNYAPGKDRINPRSIASEMEKKVIKGQTKNIILNLNDSPIDIKLLKKQLKDFPIKDLEEVIAIKGNSIMNIYP